MTTSLTDDGYRRTRFRPHANRETLWVTLCGSYFQRLIEPEFHVLELGAGYANFINNIRCRTRTAVDLWPGLPGHVQRGVLRPNYRRAYREYFDDCTHIAVYSDVT